MNEPPDKKQKYIDWGDIRSGRINISQTGSAMVGGNVSGDKFVGRDTIDWGESPSSIRGHLDHAIEYIHASAHGTAEQRTQLVALVTALSEKLTDVSDEERQEAGMVAFSLEAMARKLAYPSLNRQEIAYVADEMLAVTEQLPAIKAPTQEIAALVRALCDEG